jgi:hypothetical protein
MDAATGKGDEILRQRGPETKVIGGLPKKIKKELAKLPGVKAPNPRRRW